MVVVDAIEQERQRRQQMWQAVLDAGGPCSVSPARLRELGIYGGAQGVWVDKNRTWSVGGDGNGVTVGLLHTGKSYTDDLTDDGVIYHYPKTRRAGSDQMEIKATKAAGRLGLPVFVITLPAPNASVRNVHLGWVEDWDDNSDQFLVLFGEKPSTLAAQPVDFVSEDDRPFTLVDKTPARERLGKVRAGQQRFQFRVFKRYGPRCAVCSMQIHELLEAAHIRRKSEHGSDDPRNGLVFCTLHHKAYDAGFFAIEPYSLRIVYAYGHIGASELCITSETLERLPQKPHPEALEWRWQKRR